MLPMITVLPLQGITALFESLAIHSGFEAIEAACGSANLLSENEYFCFSVCPLSRLTQHRR
jgi:hypothetical protein